MALYTRMLARSCSLLSVPGLSRTRLRNLGKQPCEHTKRQKKVAGWTEGKNRQRETSETKGEREREREAVEREPQRVGSSGKRRDTRAVRRYSLVREKTGKKIAGALFTERARVPA